MPVRHAHGHDHGHAHTHLHAHAPPARPDRAFGIGIALNVAFVVAEAIYGFRIDSLALLADAGHNLGDVAGLVLAWAGVLAARVAPDERHTWGWKRGSILAAFANAMLLMVAVVSLAWAAVERLRSPSATEPVAVMAVAAIGIAVNGATALLFLRDRESDLNVRAAFWHMAGDAFVSAGVVAAGGLILWRGWQWADPVAGLVVALVILVGSWSLFRDSLHMLFDGVPAAIDLDAVRAELCALPGVSGVHDLHVWAASTDQTVLTAHVVVPAGAPDDAFYRDAAARLRERFAIGHVTLQASREPLMDACDARHAQPPAHAHAHA